MKPSTSAPRIGRNLLIISLFSIVPLTSGRAQEPAPPRQVPVRPVPVRPALRPAPVRPQPQAQQPRPQIQQRPQVQQRQAPQVRQVQPRVNPRTGEVAGGQRNQRLGQVPPGRGENNPGQNRVGVVRPEGGLAGGNPGGFRLPANARRAPMPGGGAMVAHPDGRRWLVDKNNRVSAFSRPGLQAKFYGDGRVNSIHQVRPGMNLVVARSLHGERQAVSMRAGGVVVVTYGRGRGYVQRSLPGRMGYFERTTLVNGQPTARVYRAYRYRGVVYFRYQPAYYYHPRFYQWVGSPWPRPAAYSWGWQQAPWADYYSNYFTPGPSYATPASWLTDFVLSANLQAAYQNRQEYQTTSPNTAEPTPSTSDTTAVSPEVKDAIAQEVQADVIAAQTDASTSGGQVAPANGQELPPALDPNQRTLVVSQALDLPMGTESCGLTPGDVISRTGDNLLPGNKVAVNVVASKAGDCPANTSTEIDLATLQEMHNQFREQVDAGLSTLASSEGSGGLPAGPPANASPNPDGAAQPDRDVVATLAQQQSDADGAEAAANDGASAVSSSAAM